MAKPQAKSKDNKSETQDNKPAAQESKPKKAKSKSPKFKKTLAPDNLLDMEDGIFNQNFWHKFAPNFNISNETAGHAFDLTDEEKEYNRARVFKEGYTHLQNPGLKTSHSDLEALWMKMVKNGIPPVFSFVYDELWTLSYEIRNLVGAVLDGEDFVMLPDFWVWVIEEGKSGFPPHRDKNGDSLFPDRRPKSMTAWLPITQAHPLNGGMYIVPADRDPYYGINGVAGFGGELSDVRALPGDPGDVFMWTQHAYHWGCHSADKHDLPPRMSVAFEYQRKDVDAFNTPLIEIGAMPQFEMRLRLIAKQMLQYKHLYKPSPDILNLAETIVSRIPLPGEAAPQQKYGGGDNF